MSKITELIDEITGQYRDIQCLTDELRQKYRVLGALLLSARTLVPDEKWEFWLAANLNLDVHSAESVIAGGMKNREWNPLNIPQYASEMLEHKSEADSTGKDNGRCLGKNPKTLKIR